MNYPFIQLGEYELHKFENNPFASSFTQDIATYTDNCCNNDSVFDNYFPTNDVIETLVSLTK